MIILILTPEWPDQQHPNAVPFLVKQVESMRNLGFDMKVFHFRGSSNPINYLITAFKLKSYLKTQKIDIIHAQWGQGAIPSILSGKPLIITYRGSDLQGIPNANFTYSLKGKILVLMSKLMSLKAAEIIVVSEKLKSLLRTRKPVHIIPSGLNFDTLPKISKEEARRQLNMDVNQKMIFFPAHPSRAVKRYGIALEGVLQAKKSVPELQFHHALNFDHKTMLLWIKAADIVLFTSSHEGSPNVIKEALALNTRIISTRVGDVPDFLTNLKGSTLLKDTNPNTIADAIITTLDQIRENYESKSLVEHLDEHKISLKIAEIYQRVGK